MGTGEKTGKRNPCGDAPCLGRDRGFAREERLGHRALLQALLFPCAFEEKLEHAVGRRDMEFEVGRFVRRAEENLECVALGECGEVEGILITHHMGVVKVGADQKIRIVAADGNTARRKCRLRLRKPELGKFPDERVPWIHCEKA